MLEGSAPTALVTFEAEDEIREAFRDILDGIASVEFLHDVPADGRREALRSARALLSWNPHQELTVEEIAALGAVPFVQLISAGADRVPFADIPRSVAVASNVGAYAEPMAEHVLAMALALAKQLPQRHSELARGRFRQLQPNRLITGSVCGILGFGGIGKATARRFLALGARIHAVNTSGRTEESVEFVGTLSDLDRVLRAADMLVVSLPLTRVTRGLIGRRELGLMKSDAILINVARGAIVQEEALYRHLSANPEFAAGLDAWWAEPFTPGEFHTDFPFFDLPNFLGSPHNSAMVPGIAAVAARRATENVARYLRGEPPRGLVDRQDYLGSAGHG